MILVAGATGALGGEIGRRLIARRTPVRALVRATSDPAKVEALRAAGCEIVVGDLKHRPSL
ncbi:MAG: NmrA family NAD(P)-binding protein, partial [Gemmatimonadaceae bacterium]